MDDNSGQMQEPHNMPVEPFRAVLRPNRSLSREGFVALMVALGAVSFIAGMVFVMIGAWPVMGFFGLDVLIVYIAFKLSYRSGRAFETVDVRPDALTVERVDANGRLLESLAFNPYWVRVLTRTDRHGRVAVRLVTHGKAVAIAEMLSDDERSTFAEALQDALVRLKAARY